MDDGAGQAVIRLQIALFNAGDQPDGANGVLVHRVMVVHVILHLRHHAAEIRHEAAKHPGFVHPSQHGFRVVPAGQHCQEQRIGGLVAAHAIIDQHGIARRLPHGQRVDGQLFPIRQREHFQQPHRISAEEFVGRHAQLPAPQGEAVQPAGPPGQRRQPGQPGGAFIQMRQEQPGQIAHRPRHQEIMPHEAFHRAHAVAGGIVQPCGQFALHIKSQPFLRPAGDAVQIDAHRP